VGHRFSWAERERWAIRKKRIRKKRKAERRINGLGKKVGPTAYSAVWAEKKKKKKYGRPIQKEREVGIDRERSLRWLYKLWLLNF
jgi:hypothetical protein